MTKEIELTGANLYDMNKQLVEHYESKMSKKTLRKIVDKIVVPFFEEALKNHKYFMLLCHDARDYTVFNILESDDNSKNIINSNFNCNSFSRCIFYNSKSKVVNKATFFVI